MYCETSNALRMLSTTEQKIGCVCLVRCMSEIERAAMFLEVAQKQTDFFFFFFLNHSDSF